MAKMARSTYDLEVDRPEDWSKKAACKGTDELFFDARQRRQALHICRFHCPVAAECHAESRARRNVEVVVGGVAYGFTGEVIAGLYGGSGSIDEHNGYCQALRAAERTRARKKEEA